MLGSSRRQLERSCKAKIAGLDLPTPLRLGELEKRLEAVRGRELWILDDKGELPAEITGLWVGTATRDYVFHRAGLDGCRVEVSILHEFSHMICEHRSAHLTDQAWLRRRAPSVMDLGEIEHMCMRRDYGSDDEREAELMASLILARATGRWRRTRNGASDQEELAAHRVESIFQT